MEPGAIDLTIIVGAGPATWPSRPARRGSGERQRGQPAFSNHPHRVEVTIGMRDFPRSGIRGHALVSCGRERIQQVNARADDILQVACDQRQIVHPRSGGEQSVHNRQTTLSVKPPPLVGGRRIHR
jgi:hypothetical protein